MRELAKFGLLLCALVVALWAGDILMDRTAVVSVVADAPLYSLPPQNHPANNPRIATLKRGETVKVKRIAYAKDLAAIRIETGSGQTGWVIVGQGVEVRS
jgi:hypothetical protein